MEAVDVRGRFVWHELLTRDVPAAKKFYANLMGWKMRSWPLDPAVTVCHAGDVPAASIMEMIPEIPAEAPPHWLQYISTPDVDGTADAAVRAGGSIIKPPSDVKGAGRYAILQDPQGAGFAIIDPENVRPETADDSPMGMFSWHELATTDHEAAFAFYSRLFGWEAIVRMDMGPAGIYLIFGDDDVKKGGIYTKAADSPGPANWLPYAHVRNVDVSSKEVTASGATIIQPPMDVPDGGRIAIFMDPSGTAFAIHSQVEVSGSSAEIPSRDAAPELQAKPVAQRTAAPSARRRTKSKSKTKARPRARARKTKSKAKVVRRKASTKSKIRAKTKTKTRTRSVSPARVSRKKSKAKKTRLVRRKK